MLVPESIFQSQEEAHLSIKSVFDIIRSREFLLISAGTLSVTGAVALCILVNYNFFIYTVNVLTIVACILIFATFIFAQVSRNKEDITDTNGQSEVVDGFFAALGCGYLFVGLLTLGSAASVIHVRSNVSPTGASAQLEMYIRVIEWFSWLIGVILVHRSFKGHKMVLAYLTFLTTFTTFVLLGIFYWGVFPTVATSGVRPDGTPTSYASTFRYYVSASWCFWFTGFLIALVLRRKHFSKDVFVFVLVALILRIINLTLNAALRDLGPSGLDALQLITRLSSFVFLYFSVGTSVLRDPLKTLYFSLGLQQAATQNQSLVVSWMVDQVPTICILTDESAITIHVNKFGQSKLKSNPKTPLLGANFLSFLVFPSDETRDSVQKQINDAISHPSASGNVIVFQSLGTLAERDRVIEWTMKVMRSSVHISAADGSSRGSTDLEAQTTFSSSAETTRDSVTLLYIGRDMTEEIQREKFLMEARNNAERLALMQENFVANTSHELRTPLNCIVGVTDLLMLSPIDVSDKEMVSMVRTSANTLLALINDLLEFAKLKQGQMKLKYGPVVLRRFVESSVMSMNVLYEKSNIDFCWWIRRNCPSIIQSDDTRVRQIIFNLLSNAVKFTPKGQILLTAEMEEENFIRFKVIDSGMGIPPEGLRSLFSRFFQVDHEGANQKQGTGI
ncbi:PAS fold family protein, partial [Planoprotostelium fungivorum]